jgi:hypothetical protein
MYADDVVIFTDPSSAELLSIKQLMESFGKASGLVTNFTKSTILPICC